MVGWMFIVTALFGLAATIAPSFEFRSLMEHVMPGGISHADFIHAMIHPAARQRQRPVGLRAATTHRSVHVRQRVGQQPRPVRSHVRRGVVRRRRPVAGLRRRRDPARWPRSRSSTPSTVACGWAWRWPSSSPSSGSRSPGRPSPLNLLIVGVGRRHHRLRGEPALRHGRPPVSSIRTATNGAETSRAR